MKHITRDLIRKRAEHNEGIISTLEEISLHQEELIGINEVLGATCRKLKILYLQNNCIPKMENLQHLKDLEYLNLALNNIQKIEGLSNCEFLRKLDLTVNFIDVDELEESINHLQTCNSLRELYLMGNPAQASWDKFNQYVIAKLPQLNHLDGTEITKSMRIIAVQQLESMENELRKLAEEKKIENLEKKQSLAKVEEIADSDLTENTPESRLEIYKELAEQKKEKEDRENANKPKERDYTKEHQEALEKQRQAEMEADEKTIKQKNEGHWTFKWDEDSGNVILIVCLPKHLDSSLIDIDIHPTYISIVIKSKVLRLHLPAEVIVSKAKSQRSKLTGELKITMPKVNARDTVLVSSKSIEEKKSSTTKAKSQSGATKTFPKKLSLQEQLLAEATGAAQTSTSTVDIKNIVPQRNENKDNNMSQPEPPVASLNQLKIQELD